MYKQYKVMLQKIESTHNIMTQDTLEGITYDLPKLNESITIIYKATNKLDDRTLRYFTTSPIQTMEVYETKGIQVYNFKTLNSTYLLHVDLGYDN